MRGEYLPDCRRATAPGFSGCPVDPGEGILGWERRAPVRTLQEPGGSGSRTPATARRGERVRPMGRMGAAGVWAAGSS
ncbi:hypothetical protein [Bittarella massiliensis (ex Durand et al. 2017)]|uniref:hypothetical protein n=1 Tax=Bittarella massiliensis (ex Durand et al. 2017) TaxID=1720313 RepID=UPI001AA0C580|nr:hypothetical protein [Bittarella massiliensis (ex Durand et al. 2017)]MBO1680649.1 hypothetical protein [Bittarella massiliensis (ex Durand et al. 2017)]